MRDLEIIAGIIPIEFPLQEHSFGGAINKLKVYLSNLSAVQLIKAVKRRQKAKLWGSQHNYVDAT